MNIREEEYILAIARCGNIKNASEELSISAPGLSIFLSTLEKNLGAKLFHRVGKRFVPTDIGKLYISYASKMAGFKQEFEAKANDMKNEVTGTISVGMHPRRTTFILPKALSALARNYPNVDVKVYEGDSKNLFAKVLNGELDFIIINRKIPTNALDYKEIYRDRIVCVLSASHRLAGCGKKIDGEKLEWMDLRMLKDERFILQHPEQTSRMYTDIALAHSGLIPARTIVIENLETASQAAAEGYGVAFNMYNFTRNFIYTKPVKYYLIGDTNFFVSYYQVKRKDRYLPRYANLFASTLHNAVSEDL